MRRPLIVTLLACVGLPLFGSESNLRESMLPPHALALPRVNRASVRNDCTHPRKVYGELRGGHQALKLSSEIKFPANVSHQISPWTPERGIRRVWLDDRGRSFKELMATADWLADRTNDGERPNAQRPAAASQQRPARMRPGSTHTSSPLLVMTLLLPTFAGFGLRKSGRRAVVSRTRDICFIAERDGGVRNDSPDGFGLYYHDCRYLSGYQVRIAGTAPIAIFTEMSKSFLTAFELTHPQLKLENGDVLPEGWLGMTLYRVVDNADCAVHDVLTVENYVDKDYEIPLSFEFHSNFDCLGCHGCRIGHRHEPVWQNDVLTMSFDGADKVTRRLDIHTHPKPDKRFGSHADFKLKLGAHRREQVTLSFQIVESAARQLEFQSAESESRTV